MARSKKAKPLNRKALILYVVSGSLLLYLFGLFNPLTGAWFQYPYYRMFCGKKPIITSSIMARTYHTPDMKAYEGKIRTSSGLYCTEEEAMKAGFQKSSAL
jgi:hypothetical protein